jgi:hypothetical protein
MSWRSGWHRGQLSHAAESALPFEIILDFIAD